MMRMFVAAVPPEHVVDDLEDFLEPRRDAAPWRWTRPEQWHLTLAFCETVPDRSLDDFVERLGQAARKRRPMVASVAGGGAFPNVVQGKVLWAGLSLPDPGDEEELARLVAGARAAASTAGIEVDGARFRAHLTLARMRRTELTRWVQLLDGYRGPEWDLTEISLIASHLGEGPGNRPRYEVVDRWPLGPAEQPTQPR